MLSRITALALASLSLPPATAVGQSSMFEYEVCFRKAETLADYKTMDWNRAIFACSRLIADAGLPPDMRAKAYRQRSTAYIFKKERGRAFADLSEAIKLDPKHAESYNERAAMYRLDGQLALALADLNEVIRLEPQNDGAYMNRAQVYDMKGDYARAIADCDTAIRINPKVAYWYVVRGEYHEKKGNKDLAIADFRKSLVVDPSRPEGMEHLKRLGAQP